MADNAKWLDEANKKFESCAYSIIVGTACKCSLDGYPVLDCPGCKTYKERKNKEDKV